MSAIDNRNARITREASATWMVVIRAASPVIRPVAATMGLDPNNQATDGGVGVEYDRYKKF